MARLSATKLDHKATNNNNNHELKLLAQLTERELEVLKLTAEGHSIKDIARKLHRAQGTIARHRENIMTKLKIHDRVALTRFAIRTNLIEA